MNSRWMYLEANPTSGPQGWFLPQSRAKTVWIWNDPQLASCTLNPQMVVLFGVLWSWPWGRVEEVGMSLRLHQASYLFPFLLPDHMKWRMPLPHVPNHSATIMGSQPVGSRTIDRRMWSWEQKWIIPSSALFTRILEGGHGVSRRRRKKVWWVKALII